MRRGRGGRSWCRPRRWRGGGAWCRPRGWPAAWARASSWAPSPACIRRCAPRGWPPPRPCAPCDGPAQRVWRARVLWTLGAGRCPTVVGQMTAATPVTDARAEQLLIELAGPGARFREHQLEAVRDLVEDRARVLCVQRTGWGKSAVYFVATKLLREAGAGPTLIVSPLLALMRNQIAAAELLGIRAHTVNSTNRDAWGEVRSLLEADAVDVLLISPERLNNPQFRSAMLPLFAERVGLLVIDEAHCISDWGHDFRPDYRRIAEMLERLPGGVPVLCTTATANDRVVADVEEQLRVGQAAELRSYRGPLGRSSLRFEVVDLPGQADRLAWLATHLPELPGSGVASTPPKAAPGP